jgi:hypothetical protein
MSFINLFSSNTCEIGIAVAGMTAAAATLTFVVRGYIRFNEIVCDFVTSLQQERNWQPETIKIIRSLCPFVSSISIAVSCVGFSILGVSAGVLALGIYTLSLAILGIVTSS